MIINKKIELKGYEQQVFNNLFFHVQKYGKDNYLDFGICEVRFESGTGGQTEFLTLTNIAGNNYNFDKIVLKRNQGDESSLYALLDYDPLLVSEGLRHIPPDGDLYTLALELEESTLRTVYIDISDIAEKYRMDWLRSNIYDRVKENANLTNKFRMGSDDVEIELVKTTQSSLPPNMYPLDFMRMMVFRKGDKEFSVITDTGRDGRNKWFLVLPFAEMERGRELPHFIRLFGEISPHFIKLFNEASSKQ